MLEINKIKETLEKESFKTKFGEVHTIKEQLITSKGPVCKIGDLCFVGEQKVPCEVISLKGSDVNLMPLTTLTGLKVGDRVYLKENNVELPDVNKLLGHVINGVGEFIDGAKFEKEERYPIPLHRPAPNALYRKRISTIFPTGVKSIDSLLTIGEGQKIGIFAGSGVGKSTLLGMIAKKAQADVNVVALIGERGREVREFMERDLGEEGLKKSVVVIATGDEQPLMKVKAAQLATSIAEEFRDQGKSVLLMMDSITRFSMARREIDILNDQYPIEGKSPSMEPFLQQLLERAGTNDKGSITGIYTVLVEGDDLQGPIPDMARGILDGHIVLSRALADRDHFPAIDVLSSVSRVMTDDLVGEEHWKLARKIRKYLAIYRENEDEIKLGAIQIGQDEEVDKAIRSKKTIDQFLMQGMKEYYSFEQIIKLMRDVANGI